MCNAIQCQKAFIKTEVQNTKTVRFCHKYAETSEQWNPYNYINKYTTIPHSLYFSSPTPRRPPAAAWCHRGRKYRRTEEKIEANWHKKCKMRATNSVWGWIFWHTFDRNSFNIQTKQVLFRVLQTALPRRWLVLYQRKRLSRDLALCSEPALFRMSLTQTDGYKNIYKKN